MIDNNEVSIVLQRAKEVEQKIKDIEKQNQEISNKLIELSTKKQQLIEELSSLNIKEEDLESTRERLKQEVQSGITEFEQLNK